MKRIAMKLWKKHFFHLLTLVSVETTILLNKHRKTRGKKLKTLSAVVKDITFGMTDEAFATTAGDMTTFLESTFRNGVLNQRELQMTRFWYPICKAGLCLEGCFEAYHTKADFTI